MEPRAPHRQAESGWKQRWKCWSSAPPPASRSWPEDAPCWTGRTKDSATQWEQQRNTFTVLRWPLLFFVLFLDMVLFFSASSWLVNSNLKPVPLSYSNPSRIASKVEGQVGVPLGLQILLLSLRPPIPDILFMTVLMKLRKIFKSPSVSLYFILLLLRDWIFFIYFLKNVYRYTK